MDQALSNFIKKNSRMPLPELKLELMKSGFSSYQIEQALKHTKAKRQSFFVYSAIFLIIIIFLVIITLIFISFIQPAEELTKIPIQKQAEEQKWIAVPSEQPAAPDKPYNEEIKQTTPEQKKIIAMPNVDIKESVSKTLDEIRAISDSNSETALEECKLYKNIDDCISLIAKNTNDPELCQQITASNIKDNCFLFFGQADEVYCTNILSSTARRSCFLLAEIENV